MEEKLLINQKNNNEYIKQEIITLFEDGINYKNIEEKDIYRENKKKQIVFNNKDEFFLKIKENKGISILTGSNGIGKTHLIELINNEFNEKSIMIKLKEYNLLSELISKINFEDVEYIIFDGLDEINTSVQETIIEYIFSIKDKKVIISSRKDYLQKNNMLNEKFNIYEIQNLKEDIVKEILEANSIKIEYVSSIFHLLLIPRYLKNIIEIKDTIAISNNLCKYDLLDLFINKHLDVLNNRTINKINSNIHKKILQSMSLVMMMMGKMNLTIEEFVYFLSRINYLDIKNYVLDKSLIDTFLNNQILLNYGNLIQFENKEIMEFLAAKEIIENNFSNSELYNLVTNKNLTIDSFWFNTITYLISKSKIYKKLIFDYLYNNIDNQENLIDLLLSISYQNEDKEFVEKIINKFLLQYTKLYQYISFYDDTNAIYRILSINYKGCLNKLISKLSEIDLNKEIDDFSIIYINNILSCIKTIIENYSMDDNEEDKLKLVFQKNNFINNDKFKVRYFSIYILIFNPSEVDFLIKNNYINDRIFSILLYDYNQINKLKNIDLLINQYVINKDSEYFSYGLEKRVKKFLIENYNITRIKELLKNLNSNEDIINFLKFMNENDLNEFFEKFDNKSIVEILYKKIIKKFFIVGDNQDINAKEKMLYRYYDKNKSFEMIIKLCIKYRMIKLSELSNYTAETHYIVSCVYDLVIKEFLITNISIDKIYISLNNKDALFIVWRNDLNMEQKASYEKNIKVFFPDLYNEYLKMLEKNSSRDYIKLDSKLIKMENLNNIFYKIENIYDILKNEQQYKLLLDNSIMNNRLKRIVKEIDTYIKELDISKLNIQYNSQTSEYNLNYDYIYYGKAIFILSKMTYNINNYNSKNIILLQKEEDNYENIIKYSDNDYKILLDFLKKDQAEGYIKYYLYDIIEKLKNEYLNELFEMIFEWIYKIEFDEYDINKILNVLYENNTLVKIPQVTKLYKYKKLKRCQDLMILLGSEIEIKERIKYIKENLVFEGDLLKIEKNGNFEYSTGSYTDVLSKIGISNKDYILDLLEFSFKKYNEQGDYYRFTKYILDMVTKFIRYNINYNETNQIIEKIVELESKNKNRYLYNICKSISNLKQVKVENIGVVIKKLNSIMNSYNTKIYSYEEFFDIVKNIIKKNIFDDIERMQFFEIFRDKNKDKKIRKLKEETYQFLIKYELERLLLLRGFKTEVVLESTGLDKKRCDIQLVSDGFIQNIVIETKLMSNHDLDNEVSIKEYIEGKLDIYRSEFNSPKILFVLINQEKTTKKCNEKLRFINNNNNNFVVPILIDLKKYFD